MNSRFDSEAFGSQPLFYETEEEAKRSRLKLSRPSKPPAGRKSPVKGRPRPGVKFPVRPLAFAVWPGLAPLGLIPAPAQEPRGQEPRKDAGPSGTPPPPPDSDQVREGSEYVRWVQNTLNQVMSLRLPVNGIMGPETRSAIRNFQTRQGLPVDGIVGPQIEAALIAISGNRLPQAPDAASEFEFEWETMEDMELWEQIAQEAARKARSRCSDSPVQWAREKLKKMSGWWVDQNVDPQVGKLYVGKTIREMTPKVFPGVPAEAIIGFCANANIKENTTEGVPSQKFHEIGLFGTEAGPRNGPAPSPDPKAEDNSWGRLAHHPTVKKLLGGRPATMKHNQWKVAIPDQAAVGLVNVRLHGHTVAAKLDSSIRPDVTKSSSPFFIACCFMGWSAGDGRAVRHLNRFKDVLARVPEEQRWGTFLRAVADGIRSGRLNLRGIRKHNNVAYSALRTWQKLAAGQLLADKTGGQVQWFNTGLGNSEAEVMETITCAGEAARR